MCRPFNPFRIAILIPLAFAVAVVSPAWSFFSSIISLNIHLAVAYCSNPIFPFVGLFIFRYLRLLGHVFSFWLLYKPASIPDRPSYSRRDCTIILPTIDPENEDFAECILSCLRNAPARIIIVTVGRARVAACRRVLRQHQYGFHNTRIQVLNCPIANKREQVAYAIPHVRSSIVVLVDDHVFWPSDNFLPTIIAPFEDEKVGGVGTNKRVRRTDQGFNMKSFWNMVGALYLERHNFEIRATNAIDGGVFVISGRTAAYRARILQDPDFINGFTDEMFFFGKFGPLNADDDNFITRWLVKHNWDIKIQYCQDALIETTLGTYPRFLSQCLRWARTTWRSNPASLFTDRSVWRRQIWCVYAVYLTSFVNFALFYDAALIFTLTQISQATFYHVKMLIVWIMFTKMIKVTGYFLQNPKDLLMLPGYILFAYFHSFIKLYAGLTFFNINWAGRNLNTINPGDSDSDSDGDDDFFDISPPRSYQRDVRPWNSESDSGSSSDGRPGSPRQVADDNIPPYFSRQEDATSSSSSYWDRESDSGSSFDTSLGKYHQGADDNLSSSVPYQEDVASGYLVHRDAESDSGSSSDSHLRTPHQAAYGSFTRGTESLAAGRKTTRAAMRTSYTTPWGHVSSTNAHKKPANVLETQIGESSRAFVKRKTQTSLSSSLSIRPSVRRNDRTQAADAGTDLAEYLAPLALDGTPDVIVASALLDSPSTAITTSYSVDQHTTPVKSAYIPSPPFQRYWTRGSACKKLHYEGKKLSRTDSTCQVASVFDLSDHIVPAKPRF